MRVTLNLTNERGEERVSKDQQVTRTRTQQNKPLTRHTKTEPATAQRRLRAGVNSRRTPLRIHLKTSWKDTETLSRVNQYISGVDSSR